MILSIFAASIDFIPPSATDLVVDIFPESPRHCFNISIIVDSENERPENFTATLFIEDTTDAGLSLIIDPVVTTVVIRESKLFTLWQCPVDTPT